MEISVKADVKDAQRFFRELEKKGVVKATQNTLDTLARTVRQESIAQVSKLRRVKIGRKKTRSFVGGLIKVTHRPRPHEMWATIEATNVTPLKKDRGISLKHYSAKQDATGVKVNIDGSSEHIRTAFGPGTKATGRGKKRTKGQKPRLGGHVFTRKDKRRLPILKRYGPGIPSGFINRRVRQKQDEVVARDFRPVMYDRLNKQLTRQRARVRR